jgi:hypothetical protein
MFDLNWIDNGFSVSLEQTNIKLTQKIQAYVLVWC